MINLILIWSVILGIIAVPLLFYSHFFNEGGKDAFDSRKDSKIHHVSLVKQFKRDKAGFWGFAFLWLHFLLLMIVTLESP